MNKTYICKGCAESKEIKTMSIKQNYCNDCYEFYKNIMNR